MNKTAYIKRFRELKSKDDDYYLFKGFLWCLEPDQACDVLDLEFTQDIFKRKLILYRMMTDLKYEVRIKHRDLFHKLLSVVDKLDTYWKKEGCSVFLREMSGFMPRQSQRTLITYFLNSDYKNNRKRAYAILSGNWNNEYAALLKSTWRSYQDEDLLDLIIQKLPARYLYENREAIVELFDEEELSYNFKRKVMRNNYFVKTAKYCVSQIDKFKKEDPISYIYIKRELGQKIDEDYAVKTYEGYPNSRRYLPFWYGRLKLWSVLAKLDQEGTK